jgi:DNA repair exonuclease SbcCD ATPase subunit
LEEHTNTVEYCEKEIQKQTERLAEVKKKNTTYEKARRGEQQWEEYYRSIDQNLPSDIPDANKLKEKITKLSNEYKKYQSDLREAIDHNNNIERHNTRISIIQEQENEFETQLSTLIDNLDNISDKLGSVEILKKAFSTNGLLAYKIENLVKDLEELTNEYLAELSDGRFSLEFVVLNDKLNVNIEDNGKSVDILSLSAGELARVNTATLLAIRKLMSSISKSQINILFLDEVTNVLDELGKERLVEILLKEENLNTYIVSHGWTHPLLEKIEVIKENEMSTLNG